MLYNQKFTVNKKSANKDAVSDKLRKIKISPFALLHILLSIASCTSDSRTMFDSIISSAAIEPESGKAVLGSMDMHKTSHNKYYDLMCRQGVRHNPFLLQEAMSLEETAFVIPGIVSLSRGDIAIALLMDINFEGTDAEWTRNFVPDAIADEHSKNGSGIWWHWIHDSQENRKWVIERIKKLSMGITE